MDVKSRPGMEVAALNLGLLSRPGIEVLLLR